MGRRTVKVRSGRADAVRVGAENLDVAVEPGATDARSLERRGRRWLIWSFIFCPCHLPLTMGVLAAIFGGTAFGALIAGNKLWVGIFCGVLYAIGVGIGFRHLRRATAGIDCSTGACELPWS